MEQRCRSKTCTYFPHCIKAGKPGDSVMSESSSGDLPRQKLDHLRKGLLRLHKAIIDSERRVEYEKTFGTIPSPNRFLQLLLQDPWFAWLKPLSELIVKIDETLDAKEEPVSTQAVQTLSDSARLLLKPSENEPGFGQHYFSALQNEPDVVLAHAEVLTGLREK